MLDKSNVAALIAVPYRLLDLAIVALAAKTLGTTAGATGRQAEKPLTRTSNLGPARNQEQSNLFSGPEHLKATLNLTIQPASGKEPKMRPFPDAETASHGLLLGE